jgi:tripeptidyl-peptidase I
MHILSFLLGALSVCAVQGAVITTSHVVHEKRHAPPLKWVKRDRISSEAILPMRVGLRQSNLENAHSYLMDV